MKPIVFTIGMEVLTSYGVGLLLSVYELFSSDGIIWNVAIEDKVVELAEFEILNFNAQ